MKLAAKTIKLAVIIIAWPLDKAASFGNDLQIDVYRRVSR